MELRILEEGTPSRIALVGRLDIQGVAAVETKFLAATASLRQPVIVDISEVSFICSLGIGMLVGAARTLRRCGACMVLLDPQTFVENVLEVSRIPDVIPIRHGIEEARRALDAGPP